MEKDMVEKQVRELVAVYDEQEIVRNELRFLERRWDLEAKEYGYEVGDAFPEEELIAILWDDDKIFERGLQKFLGDVDKVVFRIGSTHRWVWDIDGDVWTIHLNVVREILSMIDSGLSMGKVELYDGGDRFSLVLYEMGSDAGEEYEIVPRNPVYAVGDQLEATVRGWGSTNKGLVTVKEIGGHREGGYAYRVEYVNGGEVAVVNARDLSRINKKL